MELFRSRSVTDRLRDVLGRDRAVDDVGDGRGGKPLTPERLDDVLQKPVVALERGEEHSVR